jgi:biopolymer transport protein ExbB
MLAQATSAPPAASDAAALKVNSLLDFAIKGGWAMIPIALCSFMALALIVERLIVLRRGRVIPRGFVSKLAGIAHDRDKALKLCRDNGSMIARILEVAIKDQDRPLDQIEKRVEEVGQREVVSLRSHMRLLSALPQVSTMLGLLGTVFGMIKTFQAVAASSEALGKTEMLAKGIFEAWTCTAAGLLVAIPVLVAYHYLQGKIDALVAEIDRVASEWLEQFSRSATVASKSTVRRAAETVPPVPVAVASA